MSIGNYYGTYAQPQGYGQYCQQNPYYGTNSPTPMYNQYGQITGSPYSSSYGVAQQTAATYGTGYSVDFSNIPNSQMFLTDEFQSYNQLRSANGISNLPMLMGTELQSYLTPTQSYYGSPQYSTVQNYSYPQYGNQGGCMQSGGMPAYGVQAFGIQAFGVQAFSLGMPVQQMPCQPRGNAFGLSHVINNFTNSMTGMLNSISF